MSFIAAAIGATAVAGIGGAVIQSQAAQSASNAQVSLGQQALAQQNALFAQGTAANQPFINAGQTAAGTLTNLLTPGPNQTSTLNNLPGFQFAQDWGQKAVQNIGSTQGFGGNTLTAGANFATGLAQQQFGSLASLLQGLTNTGSSSAQSLMGGAVQTGQNTGNTLTGIGQSTAAGTLGSANALAGGLTGTAGSVTNALLLNKLFGGGANASTSQNLGIYNSNVIGQGVTPTDAALAF